MTRKTFGIMLMTVIGIYNAARGSYEYDKNMPRDKPSSIEIAAVSPSIRVGDPLLLKVSMTFSRPQVHLQTKAIVDGFLRDNVLLIGLKDKDKAKIKDKSMKIINLDGREYYFAMLPPGLALQDTKGLVYGNLFLLCLDERKTSGFLFDEPGCYTMLVVQGDVKSNVLNVDVSPSDKMPSILVPWDYYFIMQYIDSYDPPDSLPKALDRLRRFADQKKETLFTKMAAARLGLAYADADEKKEHEARREKKKLTEPLWIDAVKFLRQGLELPDEFLIRDELLWRLTEIEGKRKNYDQAIGCLDELAKKYPKGRRGRHALGAKKEVLERQRKEKVGK